MCENWRCAVESESLYGFVENYKAITSVNESYGIVVGATSAKRW